MQKLLFLIKKDRLLIIIIVLLGSVLRFSGLGTQSIWLDEAVSINFASKPISQVITAEVNYPPLYYLCLHFWIDLFGKSEVSIRLLSAILGILSIFLIYRISILLFNPTIGLLSAFILSVSPFHIYYSQEARMYSLITFLTMCSIYTFLLAIHKKKFTFWLIYIISTMLVIYTHYFGFLIILAQGLFLLFNWKLERNNFYRWIISQAVLFILFIPWFRILLYAIPEGGRPWLTDFNPVVRVGYVFFTFSIGYSAIIMNAIQKLHFSRTLLSNLEVFLPSILIFISLIFIGLKNSFKNKRSSLFLILYLIVPIGLAVIISLKLPLLSERYLIISLPPYYIFLALGLGYIRKGTMRRFQFILFGGYLVLVGFSLFNYYSNPNFGKEQWREVSKYIEKNIHQKDIICFHKPYISIPFNYYFKGRNKEYKLPEGTISDKEDFTVKLRNDLTKYEKIWLIISHNYDTKNYYHDFFNKIFTKISEKMFPKNNGIEVYLFQID